MSWSALVATALLGTARRRPGDVDLPLTPAPADTPEHALLDAAAALATARLAGGCVTSVIQDTPLVDHLAPPESREVIPPGARRVLDRLLDLPDDAGLLRVLLDRVEAKGLVVPPETLPELGDAGAAGGERAAWLAALTQPAPPEPHDWLTADRRERTALLTELRQHDPGQGRQLLESTWDEEPPADRAALLRALRPGLSTDDEDLLERALEDKRKPVRTEAHDLLARLPDSAFATRMRERLEPLIADDHVKLPKLDVAMKRDGLEAKATPAGKGERAFLLDQLVAAAPLDTWPTVAPRVEALDGLVLATKRQGRADWAKALLSTGDPELLPLAGPGDAVLDALDDAEPLARLQLLAALPDPWPEDFSHEVAAHLRRDAPHLTGRFGAGPLLKRLAAPVHPAAVLDLQKAIERLVHAGGAVGYAAQDTLDRLHLRLAIDRELP